MIPLKGIKGKLAKEWEGLVAEGISQVWLTTDGGGKLYPGFGGRREKVEEGLHIWVEGLVVGVGGVGQ